MSFTRLLVPDAVLRLLGLGDLPMAWSRRLLGIAGIPVDSTAMMLPLLVGGDKIMLTWVKNAQVSHRIRV